MSILAVPAEESQVTTRLTQTEQYWRNRFQISQNDIDYLYALLLERESPLSVDEMALLIVRFRVQTEDTLQAQQADTDNVFRPENHYEVGDYATFNAPFNRSGEIISTRPGNNPDYGDFTVIGVKLGDDVVEFCADLKIPHSLNFRPGDTTTLTENARTPEQLFIDYGGEVAAALDHELARQSDLVRLAGRWFPKSLLVEVTPGHLNLAEAVLDMSGGGPLTTTEVIHQTEARFASNERLAEFSLNYALQQDERFDEVGPAGQVVWFLRKVEPPEVQTPPLRLSYDDSADMTVDLSPELQKAVAEMADEHSKIPLQRSALPHEVTVTLTYPHWRQGTLPLSASLRMLFPTAYEAPRIRFTLVDNDTDEELPGWVVRKWGYVFGLADWFKKHAVPIGGYLTIRRTDDPGRVRIGFASRKPRIEWVRTAIVENRHLVLENRKRSVGCHYDDLLIVDVEDPDEVDALWAHHLERKTPLLAIVEEVGRELSQLSTQGNIHIKTLYSVTNLLRRSPPEPIIDAIMVSSLFQHVGGPYWRLAVPTE